MTISVILSSALSDLLSPPLPRSDVELYSRTIKASARVCTSVVRVTPTLVTFGTVVIGSSKVRFLFLFIYLFVCLLSFVLLLFFYRVMYCTLQSDAVRITNLSDMPALLEFKLNSSILVYVHTHICTHRLTDIHNFTLCCLLAAAAAVLSHVFNTCM